MARYFIWFFSTFFHCCGISQQSYRDFSKRNLGNYQDLFSEMRALLALIDHNFFGVGYLPGKSHQLEEPVRWRYLTTQHELRKRDIARYIFLIPKCIVFVGSFVLHIIKYCKVYIFCSDRAFLCCIVRLRCLSRLRFNATSLVQSLTVSQN